MSRMQDVKAFWLEQLGRPRNYEFEHTLTLVKMFDEPEFDGELYLQANGVGTCQRVLMVFPKQIKEPVPGVVVPFYFPEAMLGYNPSENEDLSRYKGIEMMLHLVKRGYAAVSADAYHLTYISSNRDRGDFERWKDAAEALLHEHPTWTGMGKLVADTTLMVDAFLADSRVKADCVGIAGHSLGGKMAFYTGCLDERIKVIMASDFGIGWDQTNWRDIWYWGDKVDQFVKRGIDHALLLGSTVAKPMFLLAGKFDNEDSWGIMNEAPGYKEKKERLGICNHATGHRPPMYALEEGYAFLDHWLK